MQVAVYEVSVRFSNSRKTQIYLSLEPWGEYHVMEAQETFTTILRSPLQGCIEIEIGPNSTDEQKVDSSTLWVWDEVERDSDGDIEGKIDGVTLWAWEGCTLAHFRNEDSLPSDAFQGPPIPRYPWVTGVSYQSIDTYKTEIRFHNTRNTKINFGLEPQGISYEMEPQDVFLLILQSPIQGMVHIDEGTDRVTVNVWEGCTDVALFQEEERSL